MPLSSYTEAPVSLPQRMTRSRLCILLSGSISNLPFGRDDHNISHYPTSLSQNNLTSNVRDYLVPWSHLICRNFGKTDADKVPNNTLAIQLLRSLKTEKVRKAAIEHIRLVAMMEA